MTFPSSGCRTCKIRRIKCDETLPECQKCIKSRRVCQGLNSRQSLSIVHIENDYASGHKKRPRGPRANHGPDIACLLAPVRQPPSCDLSTQAITYYVHGYLRSLDDAPSVLKSVSDDFLAKWTSEPDGTMLDLAISSKALAVFSQKHHHMPAASEASVKYGQLLQLMRASISSLNEKNIDTYLLVIFLMSRYEDYTYQSKGHKQRSSLLNSLRSFSHHDGALAILKEWRLNLSSRCPASDIIKHTRRGLIRSALLRTLSLPAWLLEGEHFGESGLDLENDAIMTGTAHLRHKVSSLIADPSLEHFGSGDVSFEVEQLDAEAQRLDKSLQDWMKHFPNEWAGTYRRYTILDRDGYLKNNLHSQIVCTYARPTYGAPWNHYFAMRMFINSTRLRILDLRPTAGDISFGTEHLECVNTIENMAAGLAASLPGSLQEVSFTEESDSATIELVPSVLQEMETTPQLATLSAWSLTIASSIEHLRQEYKLLFQAKLAYIGNIMGCGVFRCAENAQWLSL